MRTILISIGAAAMAKSAAFGVMHLGIAFSVAYAFTGSITIAGAMTVVEPLANTVAHYFFDRWWERRKSARGAKAAVPAPAAQPLPA
jgi:uncharacterized membrane protein